MLNADLIGLGELVDCPRDARKSWVVVIVPNHDTPRTNQLPPSLQISLDIIVLMRSINVNDIDCVRFGLEELLREIGCDWKGHNKVLKTFLHNVGEKSVKHCRPSIYEA